jgi:cytochrome c2
VLAGLVLVAACAGKEKVVVQQAATSQDPRAALFLEKGCPKCHSISALGVKSATEVGPDLTVAYSDVKNRFNQPLEQFLHNPTGTMQMVLSQMITLSPEERDSVIHILKQLHEALDQEHP